MINLKKKPLSIKAQLPQSTEDDSATPPPPYSTQNSPAGHMNLTNSAWIGTTRAKGTGPPPPKPKPARLNGSPDPETVTALYDYEAQAEGDLSFKVGEVIEVIARTNNENEWWTGKLKGKKGQFPGNYVKVN